MFVWFRRYWWLLARYLRPHWLRMGLLVVILCSTICVQVATPLLASRFIDQATSGGDMAGLIILALLTIGLALGGQGLAVAETYVAEQVSWAATNALRADLVAHLLRLDASFHTAHTPGELIERVDGDVATLARFFSGFVVSVIGNGLLLLGLLGLLYHVDWRVGLGMSAFALSAMLFKTGTLTIGAVYLIFQGTEMLRQPTEQIRKEVLDFQQADASIGRVQTLLSTAPRLATC